MSSLPELVQALLDPKAYPETTQGVELVQTQMSFIFLTDNYVYKVKKPVNLGYLDYTTLEKRRFYCQKEIELNRRLCSDVYLGVAPITGKKGNIFIGGKDKIIEYSVKMRRLPRVAMMDVLLTEGWVSPEMVVGIARKLVDFHQKADTGAGINTFGRLDAIVQNTDENFTQTEKYIGMTISHERYQRIEDYTGSFIRENASLFRRRIAGGKIRDCHGDLHAAHICFINDICIYDCIEFNDRFRYCDVASEIAFLAMDLDHYRQAELSRNFADAYIDRSQDKELIELLDFYKCYRAYVRGKVGCFNLDDPYVSEEEKKKVLADTTGYFELAESYI